jgi:hypothetical protein
MCLRVAQYYLHSHVCTLWLVFQYYVWCLLSRIIGMAYKVFWESTLHFLGWDYFAKYLTTFSYTSLLLLRYIYFRNRVEFPSGSHGFPVLLQRYEHRVLHFRCRFVSFLIDDFNIIPLYSMVLITAVLCFFGPGCFSIYVLHFPCTIYVACLCLPSLALSSWYYEMEAKLFYLLTTCPSCNWQP